ncbi:S-type pyocin domain-containing protein [Pseudomonas sp. KNUC1026]|uniref:S-type pyocin domain-containing protein n=1 Tax=Pseudomonas sp. KNUC1026 TaxID=2893890 RepID=UPI001F3290A1|nr:S-type pyocin domain-containing protein [Pseudomonas sp. KNUC1026]UFH50579.1 S-type pyocin domain-containing protein [Pseudomonas sp. KNUC1026]
MINAIDSTIESDITATVEPSLPVLKQLAQRHTRMNELKNTYNLLASQNRDSANSLYTPWPLSINEGDAFAKLPLSAWQSNEGRMRYQNRLQAALTHAIAAETHEAKAARLDTLSQANLATSQSTFREDISASLKTLHQHRSEREVAVRAEVMVETDSLYAALSNAPTSEASLNIFAQLDELLNQYQSQADASLALTLTTLPFDPLNLTTEQVLAHVEPAHWGDPVALAEFHERLSNAAPLSIEHALMAARADQVRTLLQRPESVSKRQELTDAKETARQQEQAQAGKQLAENAALMARPGSLALSLPNNATTYPSIITGGNLIGLHQITPDVLNSAIKKALIETAKVLAEFAATRLAPVLAVYGALAVLAPSRLGNSELPKHLLVPLSDIAPDLDISGVEHGQTVSLPYALIPRVTQDRIELHVLANLEASVPAQIIDASVPASGNAWQGVLHQPPRLITVTPVAQPPDPSTELLPEPSAVQPPTGPAEILTPATGNVIPGYEVLDHEIYIVRYPATSGLPPVYLAVKAPPVKVGDTGPYLDLVKRSEKGDGIQNDHMPSQKAIRISLKRAYPELPESAIRAILNQSAAVAIPDWVHQQKSETYGRRNTNDKAEHDANDLRAAVGNNLKAIEQALLESGLTTERVAELEHEINSINVELELYK